MKIIVAGATGAVGTPLVHQLVERGHQVVGVTRDPAAAGHAGKLWTRAVVADVMDRDALLAAAGTLRADVVVHELTAIPSLPTRYRDLDRTNELRIGGTAHLLALAERVGATRFVTQSFLAGYGYGDHGPRRLIEDDAFGPPGRTPQQERIIAALRSTEEQVLGASGLAGIALRYGLFYGPRSTSQMATMLRRRSYPVPSDGGGISSYVYLPDAAAATVAAIEHGVGGEAYNVCDDQPVAWTAFTMALAEAYGTPKPLRVPRGLFKLMPLAYDLISAGIGMSNAKARRELDWAPSARTYREGLAECARLSAA